MNCLYYVPLSQIDQDEVQSIIDLVKGYQNIGVGKIELVLSLTFQIFSNIIRE